MRLCSLLALLALLCLLLIDESTSTRPKHDVAEYKYTSCFFDSANHTYHLAAGKLDSAVAYGFFEDTVEEKGGSFLFIHSNSKHSDHDQLSCAGYLEGYLSAHRIKDFFRSVREGAFPDALNYAMVNAWLEESFVWTMEKVYMNNARPEKAKDKYWTIVGHSMTQFHSLVEGYNANTDFALSISELFLLNSLGDTDDLILAMNYTWHKTHGRPKSTGNVDSLVEGLDALTFCYEPWCVLAAETRSHCSAIVKPVFGGDLFVTHNMWTWYWQMLSVWKEYDFSLTSAGEVSSKLAFSSWPGMLTSQDDFYVTGQGLLIVETTNNVYNLTLYDSLTPRSLTAWIRSKTSNFMALNAFEWHHIFKQHNSGTYNNQWVVVDAKLYQKGSKVMAPGTIVVGSQLPNFYEYEDVSWFVTANGYWASYNVPYFKNAWTLSGYNVMERLYGDLFSWEFSPRAQIFRDRQAKLENMQDMKKFMRSNDWQHDPIAKKCPMNQISARADLTHGDGHYPLCLHAPFGAVNAKIATADSVANFTAEFVVGPTHDQQPVFEWTKDFVQKWPMIPHYGQAQRYQFEWQTMRHPL